MTDEQIKDEEERAEKIRNELRKLAKEGLIPEPRPMTRKERRALDAAELNMSKVPLSDERRFIHVRDDMYDWILDHIYAGHDFDEVDNCVCNALALYTYQLTYQDDIAAKNS